MFDSWKLPPLAEIKTKHIHGFVFRKSFQQFPWLWPLNVALVSLSCPVYRLILSPSTKINVVKSKLISRFSDKNLEMSFKASFGSVLGLDEPWPDGTAEGRGSHFGSGRLPLWKGRGARLQSPLSVSAGDIDTFEERWSDALMDAGRFDDSCSSRRQIHGHAARLSVRLSVFSHSKHFDVNNVFRQASYCLTPGTRKSPSLVGCDRRTSANVGAALLQNRFKF